MARLIKNISIAVLVTSVVILTFVAILSIWDVLQEDTLMKALTSIGVIGFSSLVVLLAAKYVEDKNI